MGFDLTIIAEEETEYQSIDENLLRKYVSELAQKQIDAMILSKGYDFIQAYACEEKESGITVEFRTTGEKIQQWQKKCPADEFEKYFIDYFNSKFKPNMKEWDLFEEEEGVPMPSSPILETDIPTKRGLHSNEVLLLSYAPQYRINETDFFRFWKYYYIENPLAKLHELEKRGFIEEDDIFSALKHETVPTLKNILKEHGLLLSGDKGALIERIKDNLSEKDMEKYNLVPYFVLTEKGEAELKENEYILYAHKAGLNNMDIWCMNILMQTYQGLYFKDAIWKYLNEVEDNNGYIKGNPVCEYIASHCPGIRSSIVFNGGKTVNKFVYDNELALSQFMKREGGKYQRQLKYRNY